MRLFSGSARYVWNRALAIENEEREKIGRQQSGYAALWGELTRWPNDPETVYPDPKQFVIEQGNRTIYGSGAVTFYCMRGL